MLCNNFVVLKLNVSYMGHQFAFSHDYIIQSSVLFTPEGIVGPFLTEIRVVEK